MSSRFRIKRAVTVLQSVFDLVQDACEYIEFGIGRSNALDCEILLLLYELASVLDS